MKKTIFTVLTLILALAMALGIAACSGETPEPSATGDEGDEPSAYSIVGSWEYDMDVSDTLTNAIGNDEMSRYLELSGITLKFTLEFTEDGKMTTTYKMPDESVAKIRAAFSNAARGYLDDLGAEYTDEQIESILDSSITNMTEGFERTSEGLYAIEGDKLYTGETESELHDSYETFELTADTLTLTGSSAGAEGYPMKFARVK